MGALGGRAFTIATLASALVFGTVGFQATLAQEATPVGTAEMGSAFRNQIYAGTCGALDPGPLESLSDLAFTAAEGGADAAAPDASAPGAVIPVAVATTVVETSLADLLASGHAIDVHSPTDLAVSVACGNISGVPDAQGNLFIGLGELNGSDYSGVGWLLSQGDRTTVTVFLTHAAPSGEAGMAGDMDGEPAGEAATPVS